MAECYINKFTKSATSHGFSFYQFGEKSLNNMYYSYDELHVLMKPTFPAFVNETLSKAPGETMPLKQLFVSSMRLFECDPGDKKKQWGERTTARKKRLVSHVRKHL